uniref:Uncharacterized protein LOC111113393 n=1 Tax=Crassostrea virginica TaxID=6565 RepID=A0A8B8BWW9_CRAVI|nr:uncharacterized protein LOC111113393 [Crassostrea virginica]
MKVSREKRSIKSHEKGKNRQTMSIERSLGENCNQQRGLRSYSTQALSGQGHVHQEELKKDQGTQSELSMADFNLWYRFLTCPFASRFRTIHTQPVLSECQDNKKAVQREEDRD